MCKYIRTSSATADESEIVENCYAGGRQGPVVSHVGRRILVVAGLHDDYRTVGHFVQHDHFEWYWQRFVGPPVAGQNGTEHGRAAGSHHLFAVYGPDVLQNARHVLLINCVNVLRQIFNIKFSNSFITHDMQ